jgi:surface antigen
MLSSIKKTATPLALVVTLAITTGCAGMDEMATKKNLGTLAGAGLGGWAGSSIGGGRGKLAATAAGTLLGALLGGGIGASLDKADEAAVARTTNKALRSPRIGTPHRWRNQRTNTWGTATVVDEGVDDSTGRYCREYQQSITVGGKNRQGHGTACQNPDGTWEVVG